MVGLSGVGAGVVSVVGLLVVSVIKKWGDDA